MDFKWSLGTFLKRNASLLEAREAAANAPDDATLKTCRRCGETLLEDEVSFMTKRDAFGRIYFSPDCRWCYNEQRRKVRKKG